MSRIQKFASEDLEWTELPLHTVLYQWIQQNMSIPTDLSRIISYIVLFLITWYTIVWMTRFVMSIIWPLFLIATAVVVFRVLQYYEPEEITGIVKQSFTIVADTFVMIMAKALELVLKLFE